MNHDAMPDRPVQDDGYDGIPALGHRARADGGNRAAAVDAAAGAAATPDWLADFDYDLPDASIARHPAQPRDTSRLLVLDRASGARTQASFRHLPRFLRAGDLLVVNETRVLRARVFTHLARTGRPVEVLFSHPDGDAWVALLGPGRRLRSGDRLLPQGRSECGERDGDPLPDLVLDCPVGNGLWRLRPEGCAVEALMERAGHLPLPPYLRRMDRPEDDDWYQTVYARTDGAVAAPTAGLHFTEAVFAALAAAGVGVASVLLHVGPGTFLPVRAARSAEHRVLPERYEVTEETVAAIAATRSGGGRVVAVGTTTVRALETASALPGTVGTTTVRAPETEAALTGAVGTSSGLTAGSGWTDCTILPGHRFRAVDAMITNFHLPRSSLLLLVAAFAGRERVLSAYAEARDAGFRFYSFGDAMLIV
jgi:S-adenosylmethionine:tRNA ribosyltransferase-isomerase